MFCLRSIRLRLHVCACLLVIFFCPSCGQDLSPLYQQLSGSWELVSEDYLISDSVPEQPPLERVTLELTAQGIYTQTFSVGNAIYSGTYSIRDANHLTFTEQQTPSHKSRPPYTVAFQIGNDTLLLIDIGRRTYHRMRP